jgi:hypothetical protein
MNKDFEYRGYRFVKLPGDAATLMIEGGYMQHCLGDAKTAELYAQRIRDGKQEVWSMIDLYTRRPVVNIEVALTESSYGGSVGHPTVSQVRGVRNECPPKPQYILALAWFFLEHPEWILCNHGIRGCDGKVDGDEFVRANREMETVPSREERKLPKRMCGTCRWGEFERTATGRIKKGRSGRCQIPDPVRPALPECITRAVGYSILYSRSWMGPEEGTLCPCWAPKAS